LVAQVRLTVGALVTVNTAEQVTGVVQLEVTVHVTVTEPPQALGADPPVLEIEELQPPEKVAEFNQLLKAVFIAACVWHAASV